VVVRVGRVREDLEEWRTGEVECPRLMWGGEPSSIHTLQNHPPSHRFRQMGSWWGTYGGTGSR
jgi:hypothetical protein